MAAESGDIVYIVLGHPGAVEQAFSTPEGSIACVNRFTKKYRRVYNIAVRPLDGVGPTAESTTALQRLRELVRELGSDYGTD